MPGIDIRIDDPTIQIDTSSTLIMIDSTYIADPSFVAVGGVQGTGVILIGLIDTRGTAQSGDRLRQDFPAVTTGCTFDAIPGPTFDSSLMTMDRL